MAPAGGNYPLKLGLGSGAGKGVWRIMTKGRSGELREEGASVLLSPWTQVDELLDSEKEPPLSLTFLLIFCQLLPWRLLAPYCLLSPMTDFLFVTFVLC